MALHVYIRRSAYTHSVRVRLSFATCGADVIMSRYGGMHGQSAAMPTEPRPHDEVSLAGMQKSARKACMQNVTIEGNEVLGEPAGVRAIGIDPYGTEVFASPRIEVWQWPQGTPVLSNPDTAVAENVIINIARPQVETILEV